MVESKEELLAKVDLLVKEKKRLYPNPDIESPMSQDEKALNAKIAELYSKLNQIVREGNAAKKEISSLDRFVLTKNINEYLTPEYIADIMVDLAIKHGYKGGEVLEPSMGHGVFFKSLLKHNLLQALHGVEINENNIEIVKERYPQVSTHLSYLEWTVIEKSILDKINQRKPYLPKMDLIIGNPPYGKFLNAYRDLVDFKINKSLTVRYEGLFIYLSSLLLKKDGLLVFIIPSLWLNNDNMYDSQKELIEQSGLTLIDAYRLPSNVFKESDTRKISGDLATDIVIFKKN